MSRNGPEHTHQDVQLSLEYLQQLHVDIFRCSEYQVPDLINDLPLSVRSFSSKK